MASEYVAFLRGISNVPMQPFRDALIDVGLAHVRSFGGTGNMLFSCDAADQSTLERRVSDALGAEAFVRNRLEMAALVRNDPFAGRSGAALFLMHAGISVDTAADFLAGGFEGEPPVVSGPQVYFVHPLRRPGRRGIVDLERELGVRGTMRASGVVARVFELM